MTDRAKPVEFIADELDIRRLDLNALVMFSRYLERECGRIDPLAGFAAGQARLRLEQILTSNISTPGRRSDSSAVA